MALRKITAQSGSIVNGPYIKQLAHQADSIWWVEGVAYADTDTHLSIVRHATKVGHTVEDAESIPTAHSDAVTAMRAQIARSGMVRPAVALQDGTNAKNYGPARA